MTSNVRLSGAQTTPRAESDIRVNYGDTSKIIAASNAISATGTQAQFYSSDGGSSWGQTSLPLTGADTFHSDPAVDWTSDGTAWAITIGSRRRRRFFGRTIRQTAARPGISRPRPQAPRPTSTVRSCGRTTVRPLPSRTRST